MLVPGSVGGSLGRWVGREKCRMTLVLGKLLLVVVPD